MVSVDKWIPDRIVHPFSTGNLFIKGIVIIVVYVMTGAWYRNDTKHLLAHLSTIGLNAKNWLAFVGSSPTQAIV